MYFIIYETVNLINEKKYIGKHKTNNLDDGYLGSGTLLNRAIKKYGRENFKIKILYFCNNEEEMNIKEKEIITEEIVDNSIYYNMKLGGNGGSRKGRAFTNEYKKNLSNSKKNQSEETKRKISEAHKGRLISKETKERISNTLKGNKAWNKGLTKDTDERVKKYSVSLIGNKLSENTKRKMSESKKGRVPWNKGLTKDTDERVKKYTNTKIGKSPSEETRKNMSLAQKKRFSKDKEPKM